MESGEDKSLKEEADVPTPHHTEPDEATQDAKGPEVCKFFLMGRCHFGDRCRLSHSSTPAFAVKKDEAAEEKESKDQNTSKTLDKTVKTKDEKVNDSKKKPRMRTADDVISRILWDSSVDPADFIVGHLDRFLGVLERPFSEFSWDTQVCDCDYSEEMAIPRHRIMYFSYKDQRVWDRDSRTDHVFGSTGQTVMPPFDRQDHPQETIDPDTDQEVEELPVEKNEKKDSVEHELGKTVQKGTLSNAEDTLNSSTSGPVANEDGDTRLVQDTEGLSASSKPEIQEEWKDSWEKEEQEGIKKEPVQSIHQETYPRRKPHGPTHFICFRVDSPAALQAFQRVQRKVMIHLPQSEPHWLKPELLHVTLCLLILESPEEVFAASEILRTVVQNLYKPPISVFFAPRLKHFNGRVLYLPPQPVPDIQTLNAPLQEAFREKGWLHRHSRQPIYHLTLAKVVGQVAERMFNDVGVIKLPKDVNFGKLKVDKLYLCLINGEKSVSGFYQTVCAVQLPPV